MESIKAPKPSAPDMDDVVDKAKETVSQAASKTENVLDEVKGKVSFAGTPVDMKVFKKDQREIMICGGVGIVLGFVMEKSKVFDPNVIIAQFQFRSWVFWKFYLIAACVAFIVRAALSQIASMKEAAEKSRASHENSPLGVLAAGGGGLLFGMGMTFCGADPASLAVQLGTGVFYSVFTLLGVAVGSIAFGYVRQTQPSFDRMLTSRPVKPEQRNIRGLHGSLAKLPLWQLTAVLGAVAFVVFILLSMAFPTAKDLVNLKVISARTVEKAPKSWSLFRSYWGPLGGGMFAGLLIIPAIILLKQEIRVARAYTNIVILKLKIFGGVHPAIKNVLQKLDIENNVEFKHAISSEFINYWPVILLLGIMVGGFLSALMSFSLFPTLGSSVGIFPAFIGGAMMIFGARMAGSNGVFGMGVVGCSSLSTLSFVSTFAMSFGAILVSLMRASR